VYKNSFKKPFKNFLLAFFVFGGTAASFSENICSFVTGTKREDILFWSAGE
jgi:hypothetical protein